MRHENIALPASGLHIICERDVGLFSLIQQVIANVAFALHERRVPIAYFGRRCSYWAQAGYRGRDTVWEYYFEPLVPEYPARAIPEHIRRRIEEDPPVEGKFGYITDDGTFVTNNFGTHPGFHGNSLVIPHQFYDPGYRLRRKASEIIYRHVRIRPEILEKAARFYRQNMERRPNIGVHVRGTDALVHKARVPWTHIDLDRYCGYIDAFLGRYPEAGIFVATDSESSLQAMRDIYGARVVAAEAIRHRAGPLAGKGPTGAIMPAHLTEDPGIAAQSGEEVVVDYLLLSRCDALVHNGSSLPRTVLLNVPEMPVLNSVLPPYFVRNTFYLVRRFNTARTRAVRLLERQQHRAAVLRATTAGRPILNWPRVIWQRWLQRQKDRREGVRPY
jgi:hypothetical protein